MRARHEPRARTEREGAGMSAAIDRTLGRGRRSGAAPRRRRGLALGEPVDLVVEQQDLQVHVAAQHVQHVVAADRQAVAVAGDHPDVELGVGELDAGGDRRRAAVDRVEAVGRHVVREARRAADARRRTRSSRASACDVGQHLLHRLQDRVVAATGAPADFLVGGVVLGLSEASRSSSAAPFAAAPDRGAPARTP